MDSFARSLALCLLGGAALPLAGCLADNPGGTDSETSPEPEDPDTTGPGPWEGGDNMQMADACEECPVTMDGDELVEAPIICSCNVPVAGGGTKWFRVGTAGGTLNTFGLWEETDEDPEPYLEKYCGEELLHESLPLLQTEFTCEPVPCDEIDPPPSGYSCSSWEPDDMVAYASGTYYMSGSDFTGLIQDFVPLVLCDDARFVALGTSGSDGFEVQDADAGELLYELGLRDGDIPIELNGYPLDDVGDVADAFAELWLNDGEVSYDLYVLRGTSYITLDYFVVFTL